MPQNNADFGMTIQKCICEKYGITPCKQAQNQFESNCNPEYQEKAKSVINKIFKKLKTEPIKCLTFTKENGTKGISRSPHNFLLSTGETLSIRTNKSSDKISPRVVGQCGQKTFNKFFTLLFTIHFFCCK